MAYTISKGLAYIITLYTITSLAYTTRKKTFEFMFKKTILEEKRQEIVFKEFWHFTPVGWNDFIKFGEFWIPIPALFVELKKNGKKIWKFLAYVSPFGPAVWPTRGNIYTNVLFYYIDETLIFQFYFDIFSSKNVMYLFQSFKRSLWVFATNSNFQKLYLCNLILWTFEISYLIIWSDRIHSLKCLKPTTSGCKEFVAKTQFCLSQNSLKMAFAKLNNKFKKIKFLIKINKTIH